MRTCPRCKMNKAESEYLDPSSIWCSPCRRANTKSYYRAIKTAKLNVIKAQGCERCSEDDPCCIDFHHPDPSSKATPGWTKMSDWPWDRVIAEIAKCVRLCSNCHRKLHHYDRLS